LEEIHMRSRFLRASGLVLLLTAVRALHPIAVARPDPNPRANPPESLVPGQAVTCAVWKEEVLFLFEGAAGEVITIRVTSKTPGLDPHVALLDSENNKEASDDDSGGQGNSLIKNHALKRNGRYTVSVGTAQGDKGNVEVLLKKAKAQAGRRDPTGQDSPNLPESLVPGQAVVRTVWEDIFFSFEGRAGEVVTVSVKSKAPGLDPHVALLDPEARKEASDDDSGGRGNSLIKDHTLMKSGRYTVSVGTAESSKGNVEVLLNKAGS
jgi:hypothetical protein